MTDVPATVESEHVPPAKRPDRIIVTNHPRDGWMAHCDEIDWRMSAAEKQGWHAFVLRVSPPVERRVEIDWVAVNADRDVLIARGEHGGSLPVWLKESIERHARIVEEPKP